MKSHFPQVACAVVIIALGLLNLFWIWALHRQWWRLEGVRRALWLFPLIGLLADGVWALSVAAGWSGMMTRILSYPAITAFLVSIAFAISLPLSGIILMIERGVRRVIGKGRGRAGGDDIIEPLPHENVHMAQLGSFSGVDSGRRSFITGAAAAIPAFTIGASINGLVSARSPVVMPNIELFFPDLPHELEGMRILHISDIHIGFYIDLHDLELTLLDAERQHPDLVLVSGDIADQLTELPEALRMIDRLKPRYGTFGSLGNHEYYAGIDTVLRCFDAGPIPLLRNSGATIPIGGAQLYVGGADDPVTMGDRSAKERFLASSVDRAFDGAPSNAFHLLMSHRPEGLDIAAERRIPMTIAGHTHAGGQIGWNGRSFIEQFIGGRYLWGHYRKNGSQLYTSAGTGHWFPFRLGVPREAPVYILRGEV